MNTQTIATSTATVISTGSGLWIDENDIIAPFGEMIRVRYASIEGEYVRIVAEVLNKTGDVLMDVYPMLLRKDAIYTFYAV